MLKKQRYITHFEFKHLNLSKAFFKIDTLPLQKDIPYLLFLINMLSAIINFENFKKNNSKI